MRGKGPAVSEILAAVAIIAVGAVAGGLLLYSFLETGEDSAERSESRLDMEAKKASELIAVSHIGASTHMADSTHTLQEGTLKFLLHNYSPDTTLHRDDFDVYIINKNGTVQQGSNSDGSLGIFDVADPTTGTDEIRSGSTTIMTYGGISCGSGYGIMLVTPSDEVIRVDSPPSCSVEACPIGQELIGNSCQPITCGPCQSLVGNTCSSGCQAPGTCSDSGTPSDDTDDVCACPAGTALDPVTQTCPCDDPSQEWDSDTSTCADKCEGGKVYDGVTDTCNCAVGYEWDGSACVLKGCPAGSTLNSNTNRCECPFTQEFVGDPPACGCGEGTKKDGNVCKSLCTVPNTVWDSAKKDCVCSAAGKVVVGNACKCPIGTHYEHNGICKERCSGGRTLVGSNCECPSNLKWDGGAKQCVSKCRTDQIYDSGDDSCSCPSGKIEYQGFCINKITCLGGKVQQGNACGCPPSDPHEHNGACYPKKGCAGGMEQQGNTCVCPKDKPILQLNACFELRTCTGGQIQVGNTCDCPASKPNFIGGSCKAGSTTPPRNPPPPPPPSCSGGKVRIGEVCSCPGTTVDQGGICYTKLTCKNGKEQKGSQCMCPSSKPHEHGGTCYSTKSCPTGQAQQGNTCVSDGSLVCTGGKEAKAGVCVCPGAKPHEWNGTCYSTKSCPNDKVQQGNACDCPPAKSHEYGQKCYALMNCTGGRTQEGSVCKCPASLPYFGSGQCKSCKGDLITQCVNNINCSCKCPTDKPYQNGSRCYATNNVYLSASIRDNNGNGVGGVQVLYYSMTTSDLKSGTTDSSGRSSATLSADDKVIYIIPMSPDGWKVSSGSSVTVDGKTYAGVKQITNPKPGDRYSVSIVLLPK